MVIIICKLCILLLAGLAYRDAWCEDGAPGGLLRERQLITPPVVPPPKVKDALRATPPPPPRSDQALFNCAHCSPLRRRWYADVTQLKQSAWQCGFDYLSVRFTRHFADDSLKGRLMVFAHSLADDSLYVDSAVTAFQSPSTAEAIVTVYHRPRQPAQLPPPSLFPLPDDDGRKIDAVVRRASTFQSTCAVNDAGTKSGWQFTLDGAAFSIEKGRLKTGAAPAAMKGDVAGTIEYRLETWGATPLHPSASRIDHAAPPDIRRFVVNDSVSVCRVRIEAVSRYGLRRCIVFCGMRSDTVDFSGEKHRDKTITFNARPDDSLLRIRVEDVYGNTAEGRHPVFTAQRRERAKKDELRTVEMLTKELATGSPVAAAAYLISRFTGNPLSWLAREVLTRQAKEVITATTDFYQDRPSTVLTFPLAGAIHDGLFTHASGTYRTRFFADRVSLNGTQIAALGNPTLRRIDGVQECCGFNLTAPLFAGKYPASWSIDTSDAVRPADGSSVLLCTSARCRGEDVTLYDLPCMLPRPAQHARFVLYHSTANRMPDTLTVTWCVRYVDRTSELFHQQFDVGPRRVVAIPAADMTVVHAVPRAFVNRAGERCLIVEVQVEGSREIFRVDAFVHSLVKNQVVGWGAASCPG
ncbi:MAG: hypothetical protein JW913_09765 [Chitinispirillaceae bacterium]|nr:hypothetical protein [Chitinispirillaceae bacterium]